MSSFLLIHGGSTTARHWDLLVPRLDHPTVAPNLPGRLDRPADLTSITMADAVTAVADAALAADLEDIVVVAHSSGGLVVPGLVLALRGRVRHVLFVSASIPPEGGNGLDCMKEAHRNAILALQKRSQETGEPFVAPGVCPEPERLRTQYGTRLTDEQLAFASDASRWCNDTFNLYFEAASWADVIGIPRTYVRNLRDRAVPIDLQDTMIQRLPGTGTITLDGGHIPAIAAPEVLAALLNGIAADIERTSAATASVTTTSR
jgi:pimeloyl-ACP methyl ester carboxylesterase